MGLSYHKLIDPRREKCPIHPLREKCPNTEFFLVRIFLYPDWIRRLNLRIHSEYRKNTDHKKTVYGHFSRRVPLNASSTIYNCFKILSIQEFYPKNEELKLWYFCNENYR